MIINIKREYINREGREETVSLGVDIGDDESTERFCTVFSSIMSMFVGQNKFMHCYSADEQPMDMVPRVAEAGGRTFILWRDADGWWHHADPSEVVDGKAVVSCGYPSIADLETVLKEDFGQVVS